MNTLPVEIWCAIARSLPTAEDWRAFSLTCTFFAALTRDRHLLEEAKARFAAPRELDTAEAAMLATALRIPLSVASKVHGGIVHAWSNGRLHGAVCLWQACRCLLAVIEYRDGEIDGRFFVFRPNGMPYILGHYRHGKREGSYLTALSSGIVVCRCYYHDDLLHGPCDSWNCNGQFTCRYEYNRGVPINSPIREVRDLAAPKQFTIAEGRKIVAEWKL